MTMDSRTRWFALYVLCLGSLMIVLDTTIVNVALPSISDDLGFSQTSLAWVVNAYLLTFGGFLLLGGRLGDLYGQRRLFVVGHRAVHARVAGLRARGSQEILIARPRGPGRRRRDRVGGLALAHDDALHRACRPGQGDGRVRVRGSRRRLASASLLGGVLTDSLDWHWIFLVNFPIGLIVVALSLKLLPAARGEGPPAGSTSRARSP